MVYELFSVQKECDAFVAKHQLYKRHLPTNEITTPAERFVNGFLPLVDLQHEYEIARLKSFRKIWHKFVYRFSPRTLENPYLVRVNYRFPAKKLDFETVCNNYKLRTGIDLLNLIKKGSFIEE